VRCGPADEPALRDTAARIVTMLNEVEAGVRPARQVTPLFALHLRGTLIRLRGRPGPWRSCVAWSSRPAVHGRGS
jgi:hypothetical protein